MKKGAAAVGGITLLLLLLIPVEEPQITTQHGLALYHDPNLEWDCTSLDWGTLTPESSKSIITYLIANSNATVAFTSRDWNPAQAESCLTLTWNITGYAQANTTTPVMWTLYAQPNITILTFTFKINITIV